MLEICMLNVRKPLSQPYKAAFLEKVSLEKIAKVNRFKNPIDGHRTLCGEILIKSMLAKQLKMPISHIEFEKNECGKPYLKGHPIYFNLSHSGDWVVAAMSDTLVGIDVELVKAIDLDIAKHFFTKQEYTWLSSIEEDKLRCKMFYMLWSGKESYMKMLGKGLSIPLNAFELIYKEEKLSLKVLYEGEEGYFTTYPLENHSLVVCTKEARQIHCQEVNHELLYEVVTEGVFDNFMKRD